MGVLRQRESEVSVSRLGVGSSAPSGSMAELAQPLLPHDAADTPEQSRKEGGWRLERLLFNFVAPSMSRGSRVTLGSQPGGLPQVAASLVSVQWTPTDKALARAWPSPTEERVLQPLAGATPATPPA